MPKILIVYNSRTGNTEKMAEAAAKGARSVAGVDVVLTYHAKPEDLTEADAIIFGSPTYHHDMTLDMKNLLEEAAMAKVTLKGKFGAAFGSYGWSGEAPELLLEVMKHRFEMNTMEPGLKIRYIPDERGLEECRKLGKKVAEKIKPT